MVSSWFHPELHAGHLGTKKESPQHPLQDRQSITASLSSSLLNLHFHVNRQYWCKAVLHSQRGTSVCSVVPCLVIWKVFLLQSTTACSISCGDTWALKLRGFQSLRMSSPKRCTSRNMMSPGGRRIPR